jgi:SprT protein
LLHIFVIIITYLIDKTAMTNQQQIEESVKHYLSIFTEKTQIQMPAVTVKYDVTGKTAGIARGFRQVSFNQILMNENFDSFIKQTVPHEVAHICVAYFCHVKKIKHIPHGKLWKSTMMMFGAKPNTYHSYDVSNVSKSRDMTKHLYTCGCKTHHYLSPQKSKKSDSLVCKKCRQTIVFLDSGKESVLRQNYKGK